MGVKCTSRLISQNHEGVRDNGPSDGDPLLFTTRQLNWYVPGTTAEADLFEGIKSTSMPFTCCQAPIEECGLNISNGRQMWDQMELLEHEANGSTTHPGPLGVAQIGHVGSPDPYDTTGGKVQYAEEAEKGRLSRT